MNKIYRLVVSKNRGQLVAVSEIAKGTGKAATIGHVDSEQSLLTTLADQLYKTSTLLLLTVLLPASLQAAELPSGGTVSVGSGTIGSNGNSMTIQQNSQHLGINWQSFSIGAGNSVRFNQPGSDAIALNRVQGGSRSEIFGNLSANGQVFLVNPNGILFGKTAEVNVGGLLATTKNLSDGDFLSGNYTLTGGHGDVINQGNLRAADGGFIVLAGDKVVNDGTISATGGNVALASGDTVSLDFDQSGQLKVDVDGNTLQALIDNRGLIEASGGSVVLTASGKEMLAESAINLSGIVRATSLDGSGGSITIDGDRVQLANTTIDASGGQAGEKGGAITITGKNIATTGNTVLTAAGDGGGGSVRIGGDYRGQDGLRKAETVSIGEGTSIDVSAKNHGNGGLAVLWSERQTTFSGEITATGGRSSGDGGTVETSSRKTLHALGKVRAEAPQGKAGSWLLDPENVVFVDESTTAPPSTSGDPQASQINADNVNSQAEAGTTVVVETASETTPVTPEQPAVVAATPAPTTPTSSSTENEKEETPASQTSETISPPLASDTPIAATPTPTTDILPTGGQVFAGTGTIATSGTTMTVQQQSEKLGVNWQSFNIGINNSVVFNQPNADAVALNRVLGGDRSEIYGKLQANGKVYLYNPSGMLFAPSAEINVGSLSTADLSDHEFSVGTYTAPATVGEVINQGSISSEHGGTIELTGTTVSNQGTITANGGTVALSSMAGSTTEASPLLAEAIGTASQGSRIDNMGTIIADGGKISITSFGNAPGHESVINLGGVLQALTMDGMAGQISIDGTGGTVTIDHAQIDVSGREVGEQGGKVIILGDYVSLGGEISAEGDVQGGKVEVTAYRDLSLAGDISVRASSGQGGVVSYAASGNVVETATSRTDASGTTGGKIDMAAGNLLSSGTYRAIGSDGRGGQIDLSARNLSLLSATLDASGTENGGSIRVGGAYQGGKSDITSQSPFFIEASGTIENAQQTFVNDSSLLRAEGGSGNGGSIVVWSDKQTTFLGNIEATGGSAEISSAENLRYVNLDGIHLGQGALLLDPKNILIGSYGADGGWTQEAILGKGYSGGKSVDILGLEGGNNHSYPNYGDSFGQSVAFNAAGNRLAVGSYDDGFGNAYTLNGNVRLFSFTDNNFSGASLQGIMGRGYVGGKNVDVTVPVAGWTDKFFGRSLAFNSAGDRLAVGAVGDGTNVGRGAVMLFSFSDNNFSGGNLEATLCPGCSGGKNIDVSGVNAWQRFGSSVALNGAGDRLAVGVPHADGPVDGGAGAVRLFAFTDNSFSGGNQVGTIGRNYTGAKDISVPDLEYYDMFGGSVALSAAGDRLAVVAGGDDGFNNTTSNTGAVRLFTFTDGDFSGGTLSAVIGKGYTGGKNLDVSSLETNDYLSMVAMNSTGSRLAVGAYGDDGYNNMSAESGAVRIFDFADGNFTGGTQTAIIGKGYGGGHNVDVANLEPGDGFASVALNGTGDRLAVGAVSDGGFGNSDSYSGAVYLFSLTDSPMTSFLAFAEFANATALIDRFALQKTLSSGTSVTLQASNDITLADANDILVNNPTGNGGSLTLQAGRSIFLNSSITTDNGDLTIIGNEWVSNGVIGGQRDPGAAQILLGSGVGFDAGTGRLSVFLRSEQTSQNPPVSPITPLLPGPGYTTDPIVISNPTPGNTDNDGIDNGGGNDTATKPHAPCSIPGTCDHVKIDLGYVKEPNASHINPNDIDISTSERIFNDNQNGHDEVVAYLTQFGLDESVAIGIASINSILESLETSAIMKNVFKGAYLEKLQAELVSTTVKKIKESTIGELKNLDENLFTAIISDKVKTILTDAFMTESAYANIAIDYSLDVSLNFIVSAYSSKGNPLAFEASFTAGMASLAVKQFQKAMELNKELMTTKLTLSESFYNLALVADSSVQNQNNQLKTSGYDAYKSLANCYNDYIGISSPSVNKLAITAESAKNISEIAFNIINTMQLGKGDQLISTEESKVRASRVIAYVDQIGSNNNHLNLLQTLLDGAGLSLDIAKIYRNIPN